MSDQSLTIGDVLFPPGWEEVADEDHEAVQHLQETIRKELRSVDIVAVNGALLNKIAVMLDDLHRSPEPKSATELRRPHEVAATFYGPRVRMNGC